MKTKKKNEKLEKKNGQKEKDYLFSTKYNKDIISRYEKEQKSNKKIDDNTNDNTIGNKIIEEINKIDLEVEIDKKNQKKNMKP